MELEMKTEGKKLEFYTGRWVSFLPFIIFLGMIIVSVCWMLCRSAPCGSAASLV